MSWLRLKISKKLVLILFFIQFFAFHGSKAYGAVYIYEVVTASKSFYTASRLTPDTFLYYNGGKDVIYRLKVMKVYADKDYDKAIRDYGLEDKNVKYLPHISIPNNIPYRTYYWWR